MSDGDETPNTQLPPEAPAEPGAPTPSTSEEAQPVDNPQAAPPPQPDATSPSPSPSTQAPGPRMVRRVVCSYQLGWLPSDWLQTWRRLDRLFASTGLVVTATLAPLEDLPADTDILVVPPELREAAHEAASRALVPNTPILVTPASAAAGAFADLVARLEAGTGLTAEHTDPTDKDQPKILSSHGLA